MNINNINFVEVDKMLKKKIANEWGEVVDRHIRIDNGFAVAAIDNQKIVGFLSISWLELPQPLFDTKEAFIDIIEVFEAYRRKGIARKMIEMIIKHAKHEKAFQIRAWSSDDKKEAMPMWKTFGFGMCPISIISQKTGNPIKGYFVAKVL